jgi:hypothetical protein
MTDTITHRDGRITGYTDYGTKGQMPVTWCHGGPGSRLGISIIERALAAILDIRSR